MLTNHHILILEKEDGLYHHYFDRTPIPNYHFETTHTLEDCLDQIAKHPCSLLIVDSDICNLSTADYCRKIREICPGVPVFFVGDYNTKPESFVISTGDGNEFYFSKPVSPQILLANMNTVLYMEQFLEIYKRKMK